MSTFVDVAALRVTVEGCPLASIPPREDESACGSCRFNVVHPGRPSVGCSLRTPLAVLRAAEAQLAEARPELAERLRALRAQQRVEEGVSGPRAEEWRRVALEWVEALPAGGGDEAREVGTVVGRFAEAALRLSLPVVILG